MQKEITTVIEQCKTKMADAINHLEKELIHIRAGKASPAMLDSVHAEYYGSLTPLNQIANISTPDPKTIAIQPWEKSMIPAIEKAILAANLGFNPDNNGEIIRINVPALTEERRKQLVKQVNKEGEIARVSLRNARKESNDQLKKLLNEGLSEDLKKDTENKVQKLIDEFNDKVNILVKAREKDIMTI
jgi:ribosome recycling factor